MDLGEQATEQNAVATFWMRVLCIVALGCLVEVVLFLLVLLAAGELFQPLRRLGQRRHLEWTVCVLLLFFFSPIFVFSFVEL